MIVRALRSISLAAVALLAAGCAGPQARAPEIRLSSEDFTFRISTTPMPPYARERQRWSVVVLDRETRQPVQVGEGRIFASTRDGGSAWDGFAKAEEIGTFYGNLSFITAGEWAMAVQFRADSTGPLQRVDWTQEVRAAHPVGS